jgi:nitrate/nitrite transporter NarK
MRVQESTAVNTTGALKDKPSISEWRAGWRTLVSGAVAMGLGTPLMQMTAGLFIIPMQAEFGWSRRALAMGPIVLIVSALVQPFAGALIDRFGSRLAAIVGTLMLCIAYPLLSVMPQSLVYYYGVAVFVAFAGPIASGAPSLKGVATWFSKNSGLAFGLVLCGVSVSSAILMPVLAYVIQTYGWRNGYLSLFALVAFVCLPLVLLWFRERPKANGPAVVQGEDAAQSGIPLREAVRDRRYWLMIFALGGAAFAIGGYTNQLQPMLASGGFTPTVAASVGTVFAISIGVGRIIAGRLLDRFNPSKVAATFLASPVIGAALLAHTIDTGPVWLPAAVAVFLLGLGQGAEIDFNAYFTLRLFGLRQFSLIFGTVIVAINAGLAGGAFVYASIYDMTGSYHAAIYTSMAIYLGAALVMLTLRVPRRESGRSH